MLVSGKVAFFFEIASRFLELSTTISSACISSAQPFIFQALEFARYRCCDLPCGVIDEPGSAVGVLNLQAALEPVD